MPYKIHTIFYLANLNITVSLIQANLKTFFFNSVSLKMGLPMSGSGYPSAGVSYDHSRTSAAMRAAEPDILAAQRRNDDIRRR